MLNSVNIAKPWGFYQTHFQSEKCVQKTLYINPNQSISLQKHNHRDEYWFVSEGEGVFTLDGSDFKISTGYSALIMSGMVHRVKNTGNEILVIHEMQFGELCDELDIVRLEDNYGRIEETPVKVGE
jgi:mannose-6-phosphate isomerase-like protein (cupin superfamily)